MRAYNTSEIFSKIESKNGSTFYVMAKPLNVHVRKLVLEMIRDVTKDNIMLAKAVSVHNSSAVKDTHTNAYNGRYIYERLQYEMALSRENKTDISLRMEMQKEEHAVNEMKHRCFMDFSLSQQESEVAAMVIAGMTNEEITNSLYVEISTVKKHVSSMLTKTDSLSRAEFVKRCLLTMLQKYPFDP